MNQQPHYQGGQQSYDQPRRDQQPHYQGQRRNPWRWYRTRTRRIKTSLVCGTLAAVLVFCLFVNVAIGRGNPSRTTLADPAGLTATPSPSTIPAIELTPPPAHHSTATPGATPKSTSTTTQSTGPSSTSPGVYFGLYVASLDFSTINMFEADAHKAVSIVMWYQHWGVTDNYQYFQAGWMNAVRAHGSIPLVTWDPWNPSLGPNQPAYSLQNIINGNFDAYIIKWAQASKAWGHPYFLRFAPEMNGNWNSWSEQANGNRAGQYVLAWRHVHDIFAAQGVTNVTWVWCPNIDFSTSTSLRELYPGDSYVDWTAMDGYNWGNVGAWHVWESFSTLFRQTYYDILGITGKPLMIAETASTEQAGNKAAWITDAFVTQIPHNFPRIRAVVWFEQNKETNWMIESSPSAQNAYATAMQSGLYASNRFAYLGISPIPVL